MNNKKRIVLLSRAIGIILPVILVGLFFYHTQIRSASAQVSIGDIIPSSGQVFDGTNLNGTWDTPEHIITKVFQLAIMAAGTIFVLMILFGGIQYMTAAGNEEGSTKAKKLLIDALIGLMIVLASYAIGTFILAQVGLTSTSGGGSMNNNGGGTSNNPTGQLPNGTNNGTNPKTNPNPTINFMVSGAAPGGTVYIDNILLGSTTGGSFAYGVSQRGQRMVKVVPDNNKFSQGCEKTVNLTPQTSRVAINFSNVMTNTCTMTPR